MINPENICMNCMAALNSPKGICPHCGFDNAACSNAPHQLECGSILAGSYLVGRVLGQGGFGITYVGLDLNLEMKVAIKEYYPEGCVTRDTHTHISVLTFAGEKELQFEKGKERFVSEAKSLAKFSGDTGIVGVRAFFYENGTAYIVMDYVEGETLKTYVAQRGGKLPAEEVLALFQPLLRSLARVHEIGLLHRDVSPDNIILRRNGTLVLLDFGAARQMSASGEHSNTINVKHGFAPEEQYHTRGEQGPWTDVYALAATMYRLMTGVMPPQALDRLTNEALLTPPSQLGVALTHAQECALLHALAIRAKYRTKDMAQFEGELYGGKAVVNTPSPVSGSERVSERFSGVPPVALPVTPPDDGKPSGKKNALRIGLGAAALILVLLVVGTIIDKNKAITDESDSTSGQIQFDAKAKAGVTDVSQQTDDISGNDAVMQAEPTSAPAVYPDVVTLTLDYGDSYWCTPDDFDLPYEISDSEIDWSVLLSDAGVTCENGLICAGNVKFDPTLEYNDIVVVMGTTSNGSELQYNVRVGDGQTYSFDWSDSARNMKVVQGYTFIATPEITNCDGFTLTFGYDLTEGKVNGTNWSVWVREYGTTWVFIEDIEVTEGNYWDYDITFDRTMSFSEIIVQPPDKYNNYSYNNWYGVTNLVFDVN
ncbi:MAG: serine/threonine-protein kinase [Clostridiaceae bacterium]